MKLRRIMIAAPKSGSGKTIVTCALLKALKNKGEQVVSYKCGPDYIDPMFHEKVIGIPSKNLDTFFTGEERTKALFYKGRVEEEFAVLEGVMGLFDGLSGIREEGSSYHLAKVTKTPVVLVVDAKGMGRSVIPLIAGFLAYDKEGLIKGVLLNRMSKSCYEIIKPLIEEELTIKVLGYLSERKEFQMESRHLGLVKPDELEDIKERLTILSEEFAKTVSVEGILELAKEAEENAEEVREEESTEKEDAGGISLNAGPVIAVARDEAFCFYYEDNLRMLKENGAKIKYFSPLHDSCLPRGCQGILLGGGYPELYAKELSGNSSMRHAIKQAFHCGMPLVAECGGFMYLHSRIIDKEGVSHDMAGAVDGTCFYAGRLVRFGYVEIKERESSFLPRGEKIRGHEFHYYDSTDNGEDCLAVKPVTGREYACIMSGENCWLGFPHLYYPSNPLFVREFVRKAAEYGKANEI